MCSSLSLCRYWCDESTQVVGSDRISNEAKRAVVVDLMIIVQNRYWKWTLALRIVIRRIWILQWSSPIAARRVTFGREKSRIFSSLFGPELVAYSLDNFFSIIFSLCCCNSSLWLNFKENCLLVFVCNGGLVVDQILVLEKEKHMIRTSDIKNTAE